MASKARGGLSKGELKRAQAAKAKPMVKRVSTRSSSKPAPLYGAGPLLPGQKRVANSYGGDKNVPDLVGAGQTVKITETTVVNVRGSEEAGAASVVMDWTLGSASNWASIGVSLKPSPGGGNILMNYL